MKKLTDTVLSPRLFALCYLPYLALNLLTVVNVLAITRFCLAFFAVWGVLVCIKTFFFSGKEIYFEKYMAVLIAFLAICFVSMLINFKYGSFDVIVKLAYFALCILVLYSQFRSSQDEYKKTLIYASRALSVAITPALIVSIVMFFNLYHSTITIRNGATVHVGVAENRLYGVFSSANVGGLYALITIWCAVVTLYYLKKSKLRPLWITLNIFQIIISAAYISVALSRGTYLSGVALLLAFLALRTPFKFEKKFKNWQHAAVRIVSFAVCTVIAMGSFSLLRTCCVEIAQTIAASRKNETPSPDENQENQSPDQNYENTDEILDDLKEGFDGRVESQNGNNDITNKRMDIWTSHLSLLKGKSLLFGVNEPHIYYEVEKEAGREFTHKQFIFIDWASGNMHNGYLQILVHCGIFAFGAFLLFLIICIVKCIMYIFRCMKNVSLDEERYKLFSLALPLAVGILVNNVTETNMVLMGANFFQAVFWFAAGLTVFCVCDGRKKK